MRNIIIAIALLTTLAGCSSLQHAVVCTDNERRLIEAEDARLVARKKEIESWEAGAPVPGIVFSSLRRDDIIAASKSGYNQAFDLNAHFAQQYNRVCVRS